MEPMIQSGPESWRGHRKAAHANLGVSPHHRGACSSRTQIQYEQEG